MVMHDGAYLNRVEYQHLHDTGELLHLFNHRNRNQHRRSIWWRHFSVFRRQLQRLIKDLGSIHHTPGTHLERVRQKARDPVIRAHISRRLHFWQDTLVSKWQHSFSQLVADGRFAVLGLVLMAILAETCQIVKINNHLESLAQAETERVLEKFAQEGWLDLGHRTDAQVEDVGEVLQRSDVVP